VKYIAQSLRLSVNGLIGMPAIDKFQPKVIRAVEKAGWGVSETPYMLQADRRLLFVDLQIMRVNEDRETQIVILEIKGFDRPSAVRTLEEAVGQYVIYRALLDEIGVLHPLYLAVPIEGGGMVS
jgi:hypothetical protein